MADNDHALQSSSPSSSSLFSSTTSSLASLAGLDPLLADFWSAFPCPPPWNTALLFRVNWTACVGQAVGERLKWFLADRCNIPIDGSIGDNGGSGGLDGGGDGQGGFGDQFGGGGSGDGSELCDTPCKILVSLFSILLVVGMVVTGILILHRRRSKRKDQRGGQQTAGTATDRRTQYTGIHYASANVINRENERPLPPCPEGENGLPRQLKAYVYNPRDNDHHGPPDLRFHLHLCPMNRRAAYRVMEPSHSSSASQANSDTSHVYDYISDTDSVRWRGAGGVGGPAGGVAPQSPDYYCTCDAHQHCHSDGSVGVGAEYTGGYTLPVSHQRRSEGYYSDHDHGRGAGGHAEDHSNHPHTHPHPHSHPHSHPHHHPDQFHYPDQLSYPEHLFNPNHPKQFSQPGWRVDNVDGESFEGLDGNANMPISLRDNFNLEGRDEGVGLGLGVPREALESAADTEEEPVNEEDVDAGGKRVNALALHPDYFADYFDPRGSSSA
nr:hypothetical protein BaRGS_020124 [Batillaria attramentaria]